MKKSIVYLQSGGPTSVINSSLYGVYSEWKEHKDEYETLLGSLYGIEGLINDNLVDLSKEDEEEMKLLLQTPGAVLGSSRKKMPSDLDDPTYEKISATLKKHNVGYILVNGGNDSMDTCGKLALLCKEKGLSVNVIGVPKTVDNDLCITDHSTGFGSAAKYLCNATSSIVVDVTCYSKNKVTIVEIMGRNAGWLTASVDLLPEGNRPDLIYIPERHFDLEESLKRIKEIHDKKRSCVIAMSEDIHLGVEPLNGSKDGFGHTQLGGIGAKFAEIIHERLGLSTRAIELNIPQRAFPPLVSKLDRDEAIECGSFALKSAFNGESGKMVVIERLSSSPYKAELRLYPVKEIANAEKRIPQDMLLDDTRMSDSFRSYCAPLIEGEIEAIYEHGIAKAAVLKRIKA